MGEGCFSSFDLPTLLRLGDLDIRGIAAGNLSLTVKSYFDLLSKFTDLAPLVSEDLAMLNVQ